MASLAQQLAGKTVLVTGATGFLAKALVAKVVRDVPDIGGLVLLVRARRSNGRVTSARDRLEREVFGSSAFRTLRAELGDAFESTLTRRVVAVEGDLTEPGLGLSPADAAVVAGIDAIINSAATVVFDERLDIALAINTLGSRRLLEVARAARSAAPVPLVHVSTAYVCGRRTDLVPEALPPLDRTVADDLAGREAGTLDLDREIAEIEQLCRDAETESRSPARRRQFERETAGGTPEDVEQARRRWLGDHLVEAGMARARERGWNDTYTYTKSLGERVLIRERGDVPACIVRPSIIESSLKEPEPGWIDGLRMADPLFAAYGKGAFRKIPSDPDAYLDFIPVDHVVNATLAALGRLLAGTQPEAPPAVYHVATSSANPLLFRTLFELTRGYFLANPLRDRKGRPIVPSPSMFCDERSFNRGVRIRRAAIEVGTAVLRRVPGRAASRTKGDLLRLRARLDRIAYYVRIYRPYTSFPARFDTQRAQELFESLSAPDKERFGFDPRSFDWPTYVQDVHLPGLMRNVLRESPSPPHSPMMHSAAAPEATPSDSAGGGRTVLDLLAESARRQPDRVALQVHGNPAATLTYRALHEQVLGAAAELRRRGVSRGDHVILQSENRPEWVVAWFGIAAAGATAVPLDAQSGGERVAEVAPLVSAKLAALSAACSAAVTKLPRCPTVDLAELAGRPLAPAAAAEQGLPVALSPEHPASILYTSGTTVDPRGVVLPHRALLANVDAITEVLHPGPDDRLVSVLPLHHAFEFTAGLLAPIAAGALITYLESVSAQAIVDAMRQTRATVLLGVPRLYELMLAGIERQLAEASATTGTAFSALRSTSKAFAAVGLGGAGRKLLAPLHARFGGCVRILVSGGAALDPAVHDSFRELGFTLVEGYGLTECAPVLTVNPVDRTKAGAVGRPLPGVEIRIHQAGADGVGEIVARGANLMSGYHQDPEATARVIRDGWFHTGDLGRFDADGYLHVTGRLKDLIVTGAGKNVYPDEVEARLGALPGVKESCVVGVRARIGAGEEVHLVVILEGPDTEVSREAVRNAVAERCARLDSHQRVQRVHFWGEELPKTALRKVRRGQVKSRLEGEAIPSRTTAGAARHDDHVTRPVVEMLARLTRVPPATIRPELSLSFDLGVDSLMLAELVADIEGRSKAKVPDAAAKNLSTVKDLLDLAQSLLARPTSASGPAVSADAVEDRGARVKMLARTAAPLVRMAWPLFYEQYLQLDVRGRENVPATGAYIVAANHQSHLDAGAVLTALGARARRLHVVAARDYFFDTPWKGSFFGALLNAIPFDRQGDFRPGMEACRTALEAGDALLIFPEGTRSPDGRLQQFKAGLGVLALELGVPIVPTRIDGTHAALPKGARLPRRRRVTVTFGTPVEPADLATDAADLPYERYRRLVDVVRDEIACLATPPPQVRSETPPRTAAR